MQTVPNKQSLRQIQIQIKKNTEMEICYSQINAKYAKNDVSCRYKYKYKYRKIKKWKCVTSKSMQSVPNKRCPRQTAESAAGKGAFIIQVPSWKRKQRFKRNFFIDERCICHQGNRKLRFNDNLIG